jgi:hypothetical protein
VIENDNVFVCVGDIVHNGEMDDVSVDVMVVV